MVGHSTDAFRFSPPCLHATPAAAPAREAKRLRLHPFAPFTVHSARKGLALRPVTSPLHAPLIAGILCRHGVRWRRMLRTKPCSD
ncbi:hypothetical protein FR760_23590 (plasmid) [Enterobacter hormaechei]|nr:hypothetical protein FR760_23590 [Enterobacter hormaechei]